MGWEIWIVPVVAIAVWIITSLLKSAEEKPEPRRRPDGGEERAQPPVELDKFLAEVRRRKQGSAPPRERPREEIPAAILVETPRPSVADRPTPGHLSAPPMPRPRPAPPPPPPRQSPPPRRLPAEPTVARRERQPARRPTRTERLPSAAPLDVVPLDVIPVEPVRPGDVSLGSAEVGQAGTIHRAKQTAKQAHLASLLRSPQDLRNAIILQEIFAPPLCKRPHR